MLRRASSRDRIRQELKKKQLYCVRFRVVKGNSEVEYFEMKVVRTGIWEGHYGVVLGFHSVDEVTRSEMHKKEMLEDALFQANRASRAKSPASA